MRREAQAAETKEEENIMNPTVTTTKKRRWLHASLAVAIGMIWGCAANEARAANMDWENIPVGDSGLWSGDTGASSGHKNFLYIDPAGLATSGNVLTVKNANTKGGGLTVIDGDIYGGYASSTNANEKINIHATNIDRNRVTVSAPDAGKMSAIDVSKRAVDVYGGYLYQSTSTSHVASMNGNIVTINSGVNLGSGTVGGAWLDLKYNQTNTELAQMNNNQVIIYGGTMGKIGGAVADTETKEELGAADTTKLTELYNNSVRIELKNNASLDLNNKTVYGSDFRRGTSRENSVTFTADNTATFKQVSGDIVGGRSGYFKGDADSNTVLIDLSARTSSTEDERFGTVRGGSSGSNSWGGFGDVTYGDNVAKNNSVKIYGNASANAKVKAVVGGRAANGYALDNTISLIDVDVRGVTTSESNDGSNKYYVAVAGGFVSNEVHQHTADADGDRGIDIKSGKANGNSVYITRGTIATSHKGNVYGGLDISDEGESANNNKVYLTNATIGSEAIYGGWSYFADPTTTGATATTTGNEIHVTGYGMNFTNTPVLAGGNGADFAGNSLTTTTAVNMKVKTIENFQNYTYNMTGNEMNKTVYDVSNPVELDGTNQVLHFDATIGPVLYEGDEMVLLSKTDNDPGVVLNHTVKDGFLYGYEGIYEVKDQADTPLVFRLVAKKEDERNVTFGQTQLVGLQMTNLASDLARSIPGLYSMAADECYDPCADPCSGTHAMRRPGQPVLFAGVHGGTDSWNTGSESRVDLNHMSMLAGLGWKFDGLLLAGFFEGGYGKYDSKIYGRKIIDGDKTRYLGGGLLARYERGGFYGEAGFHAGKVKTDFESYKFGNAAPIHVSYDTNSTYVGADAVLGYKLGAGCSTFDFMARYSWNRVKGDDFTARDVMFEQDSANSQRIRAGAEWSYAFGDVSPYAGGYYEYEFDSESMHKVQGVELNGASKKGGSGIGKLGVRFGGGERRLSADIGVEGYVGQRRGISGKAMVGYAF